MGVSYHAYAVLGVKLSKSELMIQKREKAFDHDFPDDWEVHPKTGKKLWNEFEVSIFGDHWEPSSRIPDSDLLSFTDGSYDGDEPVYIGFGIEGGESGYGGDSFMHVDAEKLDDVKTEIIKLNEKFDLGINIDKRFGLWAVLYCSC